MTVPPLLVSHACQRAKTVVSEKGRRKFLGSLEVLYYIFILDPYLDVRTIELFIL